MNLRRHKYTEKDVPYFVQPTNGTAVKGFGKFFPNRAEASNYVRKGLGLIPKRKVSPKIKRTIKYITKPDWKRNQRAWNPMDSID